MTNYKFNISEWLVHFPLEQLSRHDTFSGSGINGPCDICNNELLRKEVENQVDWGPGVPVDVFVMAKGEPQHRHVTKIGGLPYRPAKQPWPQRQDGMPMTFIGQICFADSKDLTGDLPGDVLLVFAPSEEDVPEELTFEWYPLGMSELLAAENLPDQPWKFAPSFGYIYRTVSYPKARRKKEYSAQQYLTCRGLEVWRDYCLFQYQATQIGQAPFYIQYDPELPGRPLCAISSVGPSPDIKYPWINHPDPIPLRFEVGRGFDFDAGVNLEFGDGGCVYISIDDDGNLFFAEQNY